MTQKKYSYAVNTIREVNNNKVLVNVLKYRVCDTMGRHPILTSLSKWIEMELELTKSQMVRFSHLTNEDERRAYLTKLLALS